MSLGEIAGLAALLVSIATLIRLGPERRKILADALASEDGGARDLRSEVSGIYERLRAVEVQRDELQAQLADRDRERESLRQRVDRLEAMLPGAIIADLLAREDRAGVCAILDGAEEGFVLTNRGRPGRFVWVSARFARLLGRSPSEVVALGFEAQLHPDSVAETQGAEAGAWDGPVVEFGNRFVAAGGQEIHLIWWATRYDAAGWSFARVRPRVSGE